MSTHTPRKILVIDDEQSILSVMAHIFRDDNVETVASLKDAYKLLNSNVYDLLIVDIFLTNGTGLDVLPKYEIPTIIMSGKIPSDAQFEKINAFENAVFIAKPFIPEEIRSVAKAIMKYKEVYTAWAAVESYSKLMPHALVKIDVNSKKILDYRKNQSNITLTMIDDIIERIFEIEGAIEDDELARGGYRDTNGAFFWYQMSPVKSQPNTSIIFIREISDQIEHCQMDQLKEHIETFSNLYRETSKNIAAQMFHITGSMKHDLKLLKEAADKYYPPQPVSE